MAVGESVCGVAAKTVADTAATMAKSENFYSTVEDHAFDCVDVHCEGLPARIVFSGLPEVMQKRNHHLKRNHVMPQSRKFESGNA